MSNVVVLNASYEPLGVVPLRRALMYIAKERAEIVKASDEIIRTSSIEFNAPKVVRFTRMVKAPYSNKELRWSRRRMLQRDNFTCAYCGKHGSTVDHINPQSRGGRNTWMNTIAACMPCNNKKADKTPEEAHMKLLFQPKAVFQRDVLNETIAAAGFNMDTLFEV